MSLQFTRRPATDGDQDFVYSLIKSSLGPHIKVAYGRWVEADQRARFEQAANTRDHQIIEVDAAAVGALLVENSPGVIHLHRILLVPERQNQGLGTELMKLLLAEASAEKKPVHLQVFLESPAQRFYARLGFTERGRTETHVLMVHAV